MRRNVRLGVFVAVALLAGSLPAAAQARIERPGGRPPATLAKPRIAPLPESEWTGEQRRIAERFTRDQRVDSGLATLLRLPVLAEAVFPYTFYLADQSTLSSRHRELLILRTAWLCGNQAIWASYTPAAKKAGLTPSEIRRIAEGPDAAGWDRFEATLLRFADQLFRNSAVTTSTWEAMAKIYDLPHMMDAVETVNHFTTLALLYNSLGVQPDAWMPDRLPAEVRYRVVVPEREPPLTAARVEPAPGSGIAVGRTFARHAKLNETRGGRANFINRISKLEPRHREMLILRTGWDCQSEYEWAQHVGNVGRARDHGLDPRSIAEGPTSPGWDGFERAILRAADELYRDSLVSDSTWSALGARYDASLLMSAVFTASSYRATSMALNAFGVQLEPGNERFPALAGGR